MNLFELSLSMMGLSQIIGVCFLILSWQQQFIHTLENMMDGVQTVMMVLHEFQSILDGVKPLVCPFPFQYLENRVLLSSIPILDISEQRLGYYFFLRDYVLKPRLCYSPEKLLVWGAGQFHLYNCDFYEFKFNPKDLSYIVVKREISWKKFKNEYVIYLKQDGASPQVMVSGFSEFSIQLRTNLEFSLMLKWPHLPQLSFQKKLC